MAWSRMRFKGEPVWVRVDDQGRPALDDDGRAEMKYREADSKVYRPAGANLVSIGGGGDEPAPVARTSSSDGIDIWTDGACSGNPGPMGIGVVVTAAGKRREHGEFLGDGTNNIAELVAIQRGLELVEPDAAGQPVRIYTDSSYAIGVLSKGWKAKANQELIARMRKMLAGRTNVTLVKVRGHAGVPENERCDELAREAIVKRGIV